ncbi:MAG TPA: hypothetical protein VMC83_14240 [Streptosporangiaceae bacterium]|nr:hypothetical protein [Streptosporangiaceae bacterium]
MVAQEAPVQCIAYSAPIAQTPADPATLTSAGTSGIGTFAQVRPL